MADHEGGVSSERLNEIKSAIHSFLSQSDVYNSIRDIVDSYVAEHADLATRPETPNDVMKIIREKGLLQELLSRLKTTRSTSQASPLKGSWSLIEGEYYLHVRISGGRAFVDNLDIAPSEAKRYRLCAAVLFGSQRFRSELQPCTPNPQFEDDFLFRLDALSFGYAQRELIEVATPFHIAVFREDVYTNAAELLGENVLDWRKVLKTGFLGLTVELCGYNAGVPAGIVDLQFELVPARGVRYSENEISRRLDEQRANITSADREFLLYARRWWSEYQSIRSVHKERKVKLFAPITNGRMVPVTHFVSPIQGDFGLTSPLEAARFVSLLKAVEKSDETPLHALENVDNTTWLSTFIFLHQRQGHSCNHATLLCSLLLGFGLDAFCAMGTDRNAGICVYVVTRSKGTNGIIDVTVWNPICGERFSVQSHHPYATVDCLFNHKAFYASVQASDNILSSSFDVDNEEYWKPVNPLKLRLVPKYPTASLLHESLDCFQMEVSLIMKLRARVTEYRDGIGSVTEFDDNLSYVLAQVLECYEHQRVFGKTENLALFEQCVKGVLGPGKTFKAVPVNITSDHDEHVMTAIRTSSAGKEILEMIANNLKFGIRAKVFTFPERVRSVWVVIAIAYGND